MKKRIVLLGATGSIGRQTLDVVRHYPDEFEVRSLSAGRQWQQLVAAAREFEPDNVVIADEQYYRSVKDALADLPIKVYAGADSLAQVAAGTEVDTVVNALVGYAGMLPSLAAVRSGKELALANKESLVVAGAIISREALANHAPVIPIDSEHSAIYQCLSGEVSAPRRAIITASGGPFLHTPAEQMACATVEQALNHPNWSMGAKITIDSATMVNKGFEVIEAHWLFGLDADRIDVIVHPQSIIHSMVEFEDGAMKAQLGVPDMRLPIQYALRYPRREGCCTERFDFAAHPTLTCEDVDRERFPMLPFAYDSLRRGGNACCLMNAANEVAVAAFLERRIGFMDIARLITEACARATFVANPSLDDLQESNIETRRIAAELINSL